jgi:VanZ family protein
VLSNARLRTLWLVVAWLGVGLTIYLSLTPHVPDIGVEQGDKLEHLFAYGTLMLWFAQLYSNSGQRCVVAALLAALGVGLEFAQGLTGWREFSYADMAANAAGVCLGWLLAPPRLPSLIGVAGAVLLRIGVMER